MAAEEQHTELLPLMDSDEPFFDVTMRGYDKRQVDDFVARTNAQLADLATARDQALATSADRAAQLAAHEAHIESLKARAAKKIETLNPAAVSDRIRDMLQLANEEAAQIRRAAEVEAERVVSSARADAERVRGEAAAEQQRLTAGAAQRSAEADQKLAQARTQASAELDKARTEAARLTEAARTERDRLDAEATAIRVAADEEAAHRRAMADEDFEITLRARRSAAERDQSAAARNSQAAAQKTVADAQASAEKTRAEAKTAAEKMIAEAEATVRALQDEQRRTHEALEQLHGRLGDVIKSSASPNLRFPGSRSAVPGCVPTALDAGPSVLPRRPAAGVPVPAVLGATASSGQATTWAMPVASCWSQPGHGTARRYLVTERTRYPRPRQGSTRSRASPAPTGRAGRFHFELTLGGHQLSQPGPGPPGTGWAGRAGSAIHTLVSTSAPRSTPVSMPRPSSIQTRSSVARLPVALSAYGQPPSHRPRRPRSTRRPATPPACWPAPARRCRGSARPAARSARRRRSSSASSAPHLARRGHADGVAQAQLVAAQPTDPPATSATCSSGTGPSHGSPKHIDR